MDHREDNETEAELRARVKELEEQLETRKSVDRAKGILMERGLTEQEAFGRLQKTAMNLRKPLRVVADSVIVANEVCRL